MQNTNKYGYPYNPKVKQRLEVEGNTWTEDGWIIKDDLDLSYYKLEKLPRIKEVGGNFNCSYNELTSLEGAPKEVGSWFSCSYNLLTSLEGAPKETGGGFDCHCNKLESLKGGPIKVRGNYTCSYNQLISFKGIATEIDGIFICGISY